MVVALRLARIPTPGARLVLAQTWPNTSLASQTQLAKLNGHRSLTSQEGLLEAGRRRKKGGRRGMKGEFYSVSKYL